MKIVIGLLISYLYTDLLFIYGFGKVLGMKYSLKTTVFGIVLRWMTSIVFKIIPLYILGVESIGALNGLMILTGLLYVLLFHKSSIKKRILAFFLYFLMQSIMDLTGMKITNLLTGENLFLDPNSNFTFMLIGVSSVMITLGNVLFVWVWKIVEQKQWKVKKFQWLCLLLPLSQYVILVDRARIYTMKEEMIPISMIVGVILSVFADIYMFAMLERLNQKEQTEERIRRFNHQNDLEKLRYEELKINQEESAKIRHDFQNYVLTMSRME